MNAFLSIITLSYKECVFYNCRTKVNSAYAGNTCQNWQSRGQQRDYPRLRGEYLTTVGFIMMLSGSPPLARGIHFRRSSWPDGIGITPARAGNTFYLDHCMKNHWDHPRSRGEYVSVDGSNKSPAGSPPLARGILCRYHRWRGLHGITPARAGNTGNKYKI